MALSGSKQRISGHSKKAQYGAFTGYVLVVLAILLGIALLTVSLIQPTTFSGLRGLFSDATQPVSRANAAGRSGGRGFVDSVKGYLEAGQQNADLKKEVEIARIRLAEAKAVEEENRRLKALLGLQTTEVKPVAVARLVGSSSSSTRRFAYLGAGRSSGVKPGMPVRSERGIVGRVLEASRSSSRVLLITSGAGGLYRPGIAVAIVTRLTDDGAVARIISNPAATDFVAVEPLWQPDARRGAATPIEQSLGTNETVDGGAQEPDAQ